MTRKQYLLDTNVLLYVVRGRQLGEAIDAHYQLRKQALKPLLSVLSHGEAYALARKNSWGETRLKSLAKALDELPTVNVDSADVVEAYVEIQLHLWKSGLAMGENDMWIAATAKALDAHLITFDQGFRHVVGGLVDGEVGNLEAFKSDT